ncbi:MAG: S8 family serine peptidase [Trueperaceae bacterium]
MSYEPAPNRARTPREQRAARPFTGLLTAFLLALTLAACTKAPPTEEPPPPPGPGAPSLTAPATMHGQTTATIQVSAEGPWQLRVLEGQGETPIAPHVTLSRASGTGATNVTLTVNPAGLNHIPNYQFRLQLQAAGETVTRSVLFTFPYVTGYAMQGADGAGLTLELGIGAGGASGADGATTSNGATTGDDFAGYTDSDGAPGVIIAPVDSPDEPAEATGAGAAEGVLHPLAAEPAPAALTADEQAQTHEIGVDSVTLIVGLQAADPALSAAGLAGAPATTAVSALGVAVNSIAGARVDARFDAAGLALVEVPAAEADAALERLERTRGVRYVELPVPIYPASNDQFRHLQWNLDAVDAEQLWSVSSGSGVTIAVLDNGFYPNHPDLRANVIGQYDAGDQKSSAAATRPECGTHGTHVAGIAAAAANNTIGVAGAAPGAGLYLVDLDYETRAGCPMDSGSLIRGILHVVNDGNPHAEVMNLSLGTSQALGQSTVDALRAARNAGIIIVGAAGNTACTNGQATFDPISYPARYAEVWAVGATDRDDRRACYSHIGPELFIAAPGGDGFGPGERYDTIFSTDYDHVSGTHNYGWMEGTSMAAPMVAGIVALLKGAVPSATNEQIREALITGATDLGSPGHDDQFGYGLINAAAAYEALTGATEPPPPPPPPVGVMQISFPDHDEYPDTFLDPDGIFTITNVPTGPFRIVVATDEDGDGAYGEQGEYYGEATVDVRFDQPNQAVVILRQR